MSLCRYDTSKPCNNNGTSSRTCIDCVLDKIRAEIEATPTEIWNENENKKSYILGGYFKKQVLQIIDKYRK